MEADILTRIYDHEKADYIELHDRHSDGDINQVKKALKSQVNYWENFVETLQEDVISSDYDFPDMIQWIENFENFIKVHEHFPSIDAAAALSSMRSFNNHQILPYYNNDSKQLIDFWKYGSPIVNGHLKGTDYVFSPKYKEFDLSPLYVDRKEFKIVRIQTNNDANKNAFIDIKVRKFNKKEFLFKLLSLPEFWRNFHFISRKRKDKGAIVHPAYPLNRTLTKFYTPNKKFSVTAIVGKNKKEILENVKSESPLSVYINSFAMHLFFSMPGYALPLTMREQIWSAKETPALTITLNENEFNLICIDYGKDSKENRKILQEFSESFSAREQSFAQHFELGKYSGGQFLVTSTEEFAFVYETNMIELFDSLTKLDSLANI
jgi:hypothetical protein